MTKEEQKHSHLTVNVPQQAKVFLDAILRDHPPQFDFKWYKGNFYWILAKIFHVSKNPVFRNLEKVPLYSVILLAEMGRHYKDYINYLIKWNIIECDNYYRLKKKDDPGKCKCYGICKFIKSQKHKNGKLVTVRCAIDSKSVIGSYLHWQKEAFGGIVDDGMMESVLKYMDHFTVDESGLYRTFHDMKDMEKYAEWDSDRFEMEKHKVDEINKGRDGHHVVIDNYGRHHTNFTSLCKPVRENLVRVDGERTKAIDIVSAQANFVATLCSDYINLVDEHAKKLEKDSLTQDPMWIIHRTPDARENWVNELNHYHDKKKICDIDPADVACKLGYSTHAEMVSIGKKELEKFNLWLKNDIYDAFALAWRRTYCERKTRDEIKKVWIKYIFGQPEFANSKIKAVWEREFPVFDQIISHFKLFDHRKLAHKLQRIESDIIFNHVCPGIRDKFGIPYITVHDSIIVAESKYEEVKEFFAGVLREKGILSGVK